MRANDPREIILFVPFVWRLYWPSLLQGAALYYSRHPVNRRSATAKIASPKVLDPCGVRRAVETLSMHAPYASHVPLRSGDLLLQSLRASFDVLQLDEVAIQCSHDLAQRI
ncbi:hypothetical protein MRB53_040286 [Persea americana]|nr:hypothetical protein MRB53_040286 [Persea americana]